MQMQTWSEMEFTLSGSRDSSGLHRQLSLIKYENILLQNRNVGLIVFAWVGRDKIYFALGKHVGLAWEHINLPIFAYFPHFITLFHIIFFYKCIFILNFTCFHYILMLFHLKPSCSAIDLDALSISIFAGQPIETGAKS